MRSDLSVTNMAKAEEHGGLVWNVKWALLPHGQLEGENE